MSAKELWISHRNLAGLIHQVMDHGNDFHFRAQGVSMKPFIQSGDLLTVQSISKSPHIGDVILYQTITNRLIVHRVVGRTSLTCNNNELGHQDKTTFRVRGDRLWAPLERLLVVIIFQVTHSLGLIRS